MRISTAKTDRLFSTGDVERKRVFLWKTWGKMWKYAELRLSYFVVLMLVIMAFTVSAKVLSFFMRFSTLVTPLSVVE